MSGLRRASKIIAGLWVFAFATAIPYAVYTKVHYIDHPFTNQVRYIDANNSREKSESPQFTLQLPDSAA